jgi:hypothetical protein
MCVYAVSVYVYYLVWIVGQSSSEAVAVVTPMHIKDVLY